MKKYLLLITFVLMVTVAAMAQDTTKIPDEESKAGDADRTYYTTATFKTTRLIDGHTVENIDPGVLDFKISHRFGTIGGKSGGGIIYSDWIMQPPVLDLIMVLLIQ